MSHQVSKLTADERRELTRLDRRVRSNKATYRETQRAIALAAKNARR